MGIRTARLGDRTQGTCSAHSSPISVGGTITSASTDVIVNGKGAARIGDEVTADCGHKSKIVTGDPTVIINGRQSARLGDQVADGPYVAQIVSASDNVTS